MFDLEGYLVIPNVLSRSECAQLSALADTAWPATEDDGPYRRTANVSRWGTPVLSLMDHPKVLPYLVQLLGSRLRIDHDYSIFTRRGTPPHELHGGPRRIEPDHWYEYRDGVMRNGLLVATWCLTDAGPDDGGFVCVPGSHKTNFMMNVPAEVRAQTRAAHYVRQPPVQAGDVILFTEALIHGAAPWRAEHERRALLFKYSPSYQSWSATYYKTEDYPNATAQQRRLMAPPSIEQHPPVIE